MSGDSIGTDDAGAVSSGGPDGLSPKETGQLVWQAFERLPDAVLILGPDGLIGHLNVAAEELFGYSRAELIGQPVELLVPNELRAVHRNHRSRFAAAPSSRAMGSGLALLAKHREGREIPVEISLSPVAGLAQQFVVAIVRDVSERVRLAGWVAAQRDHLALIVDALCDGLLELEPETNSVVLVNDRFCEMVGYERHEILAGGVAGPWSPDPDLTSLLSHCAGAGSGRFEVKLRHQRGHSFPATLVLARLSASPANSTCVAVFHDQTAEIAAATALSNARARIAVADEHDRIARDLHDTVIQRLFATGLMLQGSAERADARERIDRAVTGIDDAIRELRTSIFVLRQPVPETGIADSIRTTAEEARRLLDCPLLVDIAKEVDDVVPPSLRADLVAVVRESLTNVVKHASARTVALGVDVDDDRLIVHIKDDGVGFAEEMVAGGHGLRNLRERAASLGGSCEVSTAPGSGTRIVWSLPLQR